MRKSSILLLVAALAGPSCAHERNGALSGEMADYRPPPMALVVPGSSPPAPSAAAADDFTRQVDQMERTKRSWESALRTPGDEPRFLAPSPARLAGLERAAVEVEAAARALADGFSLETLEILALLRSPGVASAEERFRAALESYSQVANLDEILRQYAAFTASLMPGVGPMAGESPAMAFPFPGVLALKGEIVNREVRMAREDLEKARRTAVTDARKVYWELLYNRRAREITADTLVLLGQLEDSARARYEVGRGPLQDMIRPQVEAQKMREELRTMAAEKENLDAAVRRAVDLPATIPIGRPARGEPRRGLPSVEALTALAVERNQALRRMRQETARMELMIEMAETEIYPGFSLGLSAYVNKPAVQAGTMRMEEPFAASTTASEGAGLPKNAWYGTGDAYLREARKVLSSMRRQLADMERETALMVREGWFAVDRALREEALYAGRLSEFYALAADAAARSYETGAMPIRDAVEFTVGRLDTARSAERRMADLGIAMAALESIVGAAVPGAQRP